MSRYTIFDGSISAHCCFECTVVDTTKPYMIGDEHYKDSIGNYRYEAVCECMERSDAELICKALNSMSDVL